MYFQEAFMIVGLIVLATAVVMILLISLVKDDKPRWNERLQKEDFLPPPPAKPNHNKCEYCKSIFYVYDLNCPNCGAPNANIKFPKEPIFPKDRWQNESGLRR